jgi:hypothetical protein
MLIAAGRYSAFRSSTVKSSASSVFGRNVGGMTGDESADGIAVHHVILQCVNDFQRRAGHEGLFLLATVAIRQPTGR